MSARLLTIREVCRMLRRTSGWFYRHREELEAAGFPKPLPVVGRYDAAAIEAWLDQQAGVAGKSSANDKVMRRIAAWGMSR